MAVTLRQRAEDGHVDATNGRPGAVNGLWVRGAPNLHCRL